MSGSGSTTPAAAPPPREATFKNYTAAQGQTYARHRPGYHAALYEQILAHHAATGGRRDALLDVGCGPGTVLQVLAPRFAAATGIDPSPGMVASARAEGAAWATAAGAPVRFEVAAAEDLAGLPDASVDLLTAASAAHWFDLARFWPRAARVLRPGGTVAFWGGHTGTVDPATPNAAALEAFRAQWEREYLEPYFEPGNFLARDLFRTMPLPWDLEPAVPEFDRATFFRREWAAGDDGFREPLPPMTMDFMETALSTASPVQRWREAHPEAVGTENDAVRILRRRTEQLLREAGVEEGSEKVISGVDGVLIMVKKKM